MTDVKKRVMTIVLLCDTEINKTKIPRTTIVKGKAVPTCLKIADDLARAAINRQHAKLGTAFDNVNYDLEEAPKAKASK